VTRYYHEDMEDFVRRFTYRADKPIDSFRIIWRPEGPMHGDCDDFAVTALWLAEWRSMRRFWWALITGRAAIWRCTLPDGERHAILWHRDYGWIENNGGTWTENPAADLRLVRKRWVPEVAIKMIVGKVTG
jgi:hypothetical protein